jgi:hypothetical protein
MSGAMVGQELAAEFGPLPPSFLPVGPHRLYQLQLDRLAGLRPVHLVLPEGFSLSSFDLAALADRGVEIVSIPTGLGLGEALIFALNSIGAADQPVHVLHGDTLIDGAALTDHDQIVGGAGTSEYAWAEMEIAESGRILKLHDVPAGEEGHEAWPIAAGYFAFASGADLLRALTRARGDFIGGVNLYLEDHDVRVSAADQWLDFGHLQTYFRSRLIVTTARAFNAVEIDGLTARKASRQREKIWAEAHWLQETPPEIQAYCGRLLRFGGDDETVFYETEYEHLPVLSELLVHGVLSRKAWLRILSSCEDFLRACAAHSTGASGDLALRDLAVDKTIERLERFARASDISISTPLRLDGAPTPSLLEIAERLAKGYDLDTGRRDGVMHGDFCFSNILYDSRVQRIRAIDPRGLVRDQPTIYGDLRYDLAKLSHSITGRYDEIIAGRYSLAHRGGDFRLQFEDNAAQRWLQAGLADLSVDGVSGGARSIACLTASLFLSMLPLHADRPDRQLAFIANSLRLFRDLDR